MSKINRLTPEVFNMIAAGEVVENPASVVKELVENAIDAGADRIDVEIDNGGADRITVSDNGCGIEREDMRNAFLPHATSKLKSADDLDTISTLGFRGEALASISAVGRVTVISKTADEVEASEIRLSGGRVEYEGSAVRAQGTIITVENLFFNTPARLKFMKKPSLEAAYCQNAIKNIMLANPHLAITLTIDNERVLENNGGTLLDALFSVYDGKLAGALIPVDYSATSGIKVRGYISSPDYTKSNRSYQTVIINGRAVSDGTVVLAAERGYGNALMKRNFPVLVLDILMPFDHVDVNVHPAKTEVRFSDKNAVFGAVYKAVSLAVADAQNRDKVSLTSENSDSEKHETVKNDTDYDNKYGKNSLKNDEKSLENGTKHDVFSSKNGNDKVEQLRIATENLYSADLSDSGSTAGTTSEFGFGFALKNDVFNRREHTLKDSGGIVFDVYSDKNNDYGINNHNNNDINYRKKLDSIQRAQDFTHSYIGADNSPYSDNNFGLSEIAAYVNNGSDTDNSISVNGNLSDNLRSKLQNCDNSDAKPVFDGNVIGQLFETYIIVELDGVAYVIDQHAAHERLLYDKLIKSMTSGYAQSLLVPIKLRLSANEAEFLDSIMPKLKAMGFDIEYKSGAYCVYELPQLVADMNVEKFFSDLLRHSSAPDVNEEIMFRDYVARTACRAAIKGGERLSREQLYAVINNLIDEDGKLPDRCPHGRPAVITLTRRDIEKMFKRIV